MQISDDLRAGIPRACAMCIGIADDDVDAASGAARRVRAGAWRSEHHDPVAQPDLGVMDRALLVAIDRVLLRAERVDEERERRIGVLVAQCRKDRRMFHCSPPCRDRP